MFTYSMALLSKAIVVSGCDADAILPPQALVVR
jgi:hypothetical protein